MKLARSAGTSALGGNVSHPDYRFGNSPDFALEEVGVFPDDGEDGDGDIRTPTTRTKTSPATTVTATIPR